MESRGKSVGLMPMAAASLVALIRGGIDHAAGFHPAPKKQPEKPKDPYHCIKSRGRRGASERARLMGYAFKLSKVGKRNLRGRQVSNPFTHQARRDAFVATIMAGETRNDAMKIARRVSVA